LIYGETISWGWVFLWKRKDVPFDLEVTRAHQSSSLSCSTNYH
jgi:hypothetical protein